MLWKFIFSGMLLIGGIGSMAQTFYNPVVLENKYLKVTVDLGRGATVRSMTDKINGAETAREFLSGKEYCGALAEDRLAGDGYPADITRLKYQGKIIQKNGTQILETVCRPENPKYHDLEFKKIFRVDNHARVLEVEWIITNLKKTPYAVTPWVHNIISRDYGKTVLPKNTGIELISPSADYFQDPARNWFGGYNPESRRLIYFSTDYNRTLKHYYCYWNGYHTLEWTFQPAPMEPGASWSTRYFIGLAEPSTVPAAAIPEAVASYEWDVDTLNVEICPAIDRKNVTVHMTSPVKRLLATTDFEVGKTVRLKIPAGELAGSRTVVIEFCDGKKLELSIDPEKKTDVLRTALTAWAPPQSPYRKIEPRELAGHRIASNVWAVSPFEKIFEYDTFRDSPAGKDDIRVPRNARIYRQFVLCNPSAEPLVLSLNSAVLHSDGTKLPVSVKTVGYVATTEPSGFTLKYPVGRFPDPLLDVRGSITIPPGRNQPIWAEVFVPAGQKPGLYRGNVVLGTLELPLECRALDLTLPERSSLRSTVGCWSLSPKLLSEVGWKGTPQEFQEKCRELYYRHRMTPRENGVRWTQDNAMESQLEELCRNHAASIAIPAAIVNDPEKLNRAIELLKKHHLYEQAFFYTIDEAPADRFPEVAEASRKIHSRFPDLKVLGTIYEADVSPLYGSINIWCRGRIQAEPWQTGRRKAGDEFMSSNLPGMNLEEDAHAPVMPFILMKLNGFSGFLFWNMIGGYGKDNPWKNILCAGTNGNAHLLYPHADGPVETIRWKNIAYGIELFDLLSMLEQQSPESYRSVLKEMAEIKDASGIITLKSRILDLLTAGK